VVPRQPNAGKKATVNLGKVLTRQYIDRWRMMDPWVPAVDVISDLLLLVVLHPEYVAKLARDVHGDGFEYPSLEQFVKDNPLGGE
jgi:hypothetical protein